MSELFDINGMTTEPAEEYHDRSKEFLTGSMLCKFLDYPEKYHDAYLGLLAQPKGKHFTIGTAAHKLILEGKRAFDDEYVVADGPVNPNTGKPFGPTSQKYQDWKSEQTKFILSNTDYDLIRKMARSVQKHSEAVNLLANGVAERVFRCDYLGTPCQIRVDWLNPDRGIVDLKTTGRSLEDFHETANDFRYIHHLAFYQAIFNEVVGAIVPVTIIAVEKQGTYRTGVFRISDQALVDARRENALAINAIEDCMFEDHWPTGFEDTKVLSELKPANF